jgi:hypothetical protein
MNRYPFWADLGIVALFALVMLVVGSVMFSRMK